jgi:hypothetical protein
MDHVQQPRRKVIEIGVVGFCTSLFASLPKISFAKPAFNNHKGIVVHEEEGTHILSRRKVPITIRISKYTFTEKSIEWFIKIKTVVNKMNF